MPEDRLPADLDLNLRYAYRSAQPKSIKADGTEHVLDEGTTVELHARWAPNIVTALGLPNGAGGYNFTTFSLSQADADDDGIENARALSSVRDFEQLAALKDTVVQPSFEKATAYAKQVYDVASVTQSDLGKVVEEQVTEFNKQVVAALDQFVKNAPVGSEAGIAAMKSTLAAVNSGFDNFSKVAKQFGDATQNNVDMTSSCIWFDPSSVKLDGRSSPIASSMCDSRDSRRSEAR